MRKLITFAYILIAVLLVLDAAPAHARVDQYPTYEIEYDDVTDKRVRISYYFSGTTDISYEFRYDKDSGKQTAYTRFNTDGSKSHETRYGYNSSGQRTFIKGYGYKDVGGTWTEVLTSETIYNPATGKYFRRTNYNLATGYKSNEYLYDESGNQTSYTGFDSDGEISYQTQYTYVADGKYDEIKHFRADSDGNMILYNRTKYQYDTDGVLLNQTSYSISNGVEKISSMTEYHPNGKVKSYNYYSNGVKYRMIRYDDAGRQVLSESYAFGTGVITERQESEYEEKNGLYLLTSLTVTRFDGGVPQEKTVEKFKYDSKNRVTSTGTTGYKLDADGNIVGRGYDAGYKRYQYHSNGRLKNYAEQRKDSEGNVTYSYSYGYTEDGKFTGSEQLQVTVLSNGQTQTVILHRNENYRYTKNLTQRHDAEGNLVYSQEYFYDENGSLTAYESFNTYVRSGYTEISRTKYDYASRTYIFNERERTDSDGNIIYSFKEGVYPPSKTKTLTEMVLHDGELKLKQTGTFYESGKRQTAAYYNPPGKLNYQYDYDESGKTTKFIRYASDTQTIIEQKEFVYDTDGKLLQEVRSVHEAGQLRTKNVTDYVYSESGHLIKEEGVTYNYDEDGNQVGDPIRTKYVEYYDQARRIAKVQIYYDSQTGNQTYRYERNALNQTTLYERYAKDGETVVNRTMYEYNGDNRQISVKSYSYDNASQALILYSETRYDYYEDGKMSSMVSLRRNSGGEMAVSYEMAYRSNGSYERRTYFNIETGNKSYEYLYDDKWRQTAYIRYDKDGNRISKSEYIYNENGTRKEQLDYIVVNDQLILNGITRYSYHDNRRLSEIAAYKILSDGTEQLQSRTSYNEDGRVIASEQFNASDGSLTRTDYKYQDNGRYESIVTKKISSDGTEILIRNTTYHENGRTHVDERFNSSTGKLSYRYEYSDDSRLIVYSRFDADGDEIYRQENTYHPTLKDKYGRARLLEQKTYGMVEGSLKTVSRTVYTYYPNDEYYAVKTYSVKADGSEILTNHTEYFDTGIMKMQAYYNSETGIIAGKYVNRYDGKRLFNESYDSEGEVSQRTEYEYDDLNRLKRLNELRRVDGELKLTYVTEYSYHPNDRISSYTRYKVLSDGTLRTVYKIEYHSNGAYKSRAYYDESTGNIQSEHLYDQSGRQISFSRFDADGNVVSRTDYSYDADSRLESVTTSTLIDGELTETSKTKYGYDSLGRRLFIETYARAGNALRKTVWQIYTYDGNGLSEISHFKQNYNENGGAIGNPILTRKMIYHANGRLNEHHYYNEVSGKIQTRYVYNEAGRQTVYERYDSGGSIISKTEYDYDGAGRRTRISSFNLHNGELVLYQSVEYEYDGSGRLIRQSTHQLSAGLLTKTTYTERSYDGDYPVRTASYVQYYDSEGNADGDPVITSETVYHPGSHIVKTRKYFVNGKLNRLHEYNVKGQQMLYETYADNGEDVIRRTAYEYNSDGRQSKISNFSLVGDELKLTGWTEYTYSGSFYSSIETFKQTYKANGKPDAAIRTSLTLYHPDSYAIKERSYFRDDGTLSHKYSYTETGRQSVYERFDDTGENVIEKTEYAYEGSGRLERVTRFRIIGGELTAYSERRYEYNADGRQTRYASYVRIGDGLKPVSWTVTAYNGAYLSKVESFTQKYDSAGNPDGDPVRIYQALYYPGNNILMEKTHFRNDGTRQNRYEYDSSGRNVLQQTFDLTGENIIAKTQIEYDPAGRITRRTTHTLVGTILVPTSQIRYTYDANGRRTGIENFERIADRLRKTEWTSYSYNQSVLSEVKRFKQTYDSDGHPVGDPVVIYHETYHSDTGRLKERIYYTDKGIKSFRYAYNQQGRNTLYEKFDSTGENVIARTEYEYDSRGRTVKVTQSGLIGSELKVLSWTERQYDGDYPSLIEAFVQNYKADGSPDGSPVLIQETEFHNNSYQVKKRTNFDSKTGLKTRQYEYEESGLLERETHYDKEGKKTRQKQFRYNDLRQLIKVEDFVFNQSGIRLKEGETRYEYNDNGRQSKVSTFRMIEGVLTLTAVTEYGYDEYQRLNRVTVSGLVDGEMQNTKETEFIYDVETGKMIRQDEYVFEKDNNGVLQKKLMSQLLFDLATGRLFKQKLFNGLGDLIKEIVFDDNGRIAEEISYDSEGNRISETYNTYINGVVSKQEKFTYYKGPNGSQIRKKTSERNYYGDTGVLKDETNFDFTFDDDRRVESESRSTVTFDENGNKTGTNNGEVHYLYEGSVDGESVNTYYVHENYDKDDVLTGKSVVIKNSDDEQIIRIEYDVDEDGEMTGTRVYGPDDEEITDEIRGIGSESDEIDAGAVMQAYWDMMSQRPGTGPTGVAASGVGVTGPEGLQFVGGANMPGTQGFGQFSTVKRPKAFQGVGGFGDRG